MVYHSEVCLDFDFGVFTSRSENRFIFSKLIMTMLPKTLYMEQWSQISLPPKDESCDNCVVPSANIRICVALKFILTHHLQPIRHRRILYCIF